MSEISDAQILQALKAKAKLYARLAADFEREIGPTAVVPKVELEAVREYLASKGGRPGDLAKHFRVSEATIKEIIDQPDSGIRTVGRGWLKLAEDLQAAA